MRKIVHLFIGCLLLSAAVQAQTPNCIPDERFKDSSAGVYPLPFDAVASPKGGIDKPACIGKAYSFVFTVKVSDTIAVLGTRLRLDSVKLTTTGAVTGLPAGITYACNPPTCVFPKRTTGCAILKGTTTAAAGNYDLTIVGKAHVELFGAVDVTFPGLIAPGKYTLGVVAATNAACQTSSVFNADEIAAMTNAPNPASLATTITIESAKTGVYDFTIYNMVGRAVYKTPLSIQAGVNTVTVSTEDFPNGVYLYTLSKESKHITNKLIVNR